MARRTPRQPPRSKKTSEARKLSDDPFKGALDIEFSGTRLTGTLSFYLNGEHVHDAVPPANLWAALLALAESAVELPPSRAFLSSKKLSSHLKKIGAFVDHDPENAGNSIYRLRNFLSTLPIASKLVSAGILPTTVDFRMTLVQRWPVHGYRIALPREHLILDLHDVD